MKVSVCIITYNQDKYISQAVKSAVEQCVNFEYEVVIGDDCSTDNTRNILLTFQAQYPDRVKLLLHDRNLGLKGKNNFVATLKACRGKYVALLEGDDYWTSTLKLQKQFDFLENHPDFAICFHPTWCFYENNDSKPYVFPNYDGKDVFTVYDLLKGNFMQTCSVMFRNKLFDEFPKWFYDITLGDHILHLLNAHYGEIKCIEETMGAYRIHPGGIWSMQFKNDLDKYICEGIEALKNFDIYTDHQYKEEIKDVMFSQYMNLIQTIHNDKTQRRQVMRKIREELPIHYMQWKAKMVLNTGRKVLKKLLLAN
ncbi:MAG: glycosyltransferase [Deltaproteobacteria bacterium]|nr:glycosyltransferase [Deltaproteobacteria bacterium]